MSEHTPGPWTWKGDSFEDELRYCPHGDWADHGPDLIGPNDEDIITSSGYDASRLHIKAADAHLIVAAPELLTALKEAVIVIYSLHGHVGWDLYQSSPEMKLITSAIDKAEGRL